MFTKTTPFLLLALLASLTLPATAEPTAELSPPVLQGVFSTTGGADVRWTASVPVVGGPVDGYDIYRMLPGGLPERIATLVAPPGDMYHSHVDAEYVPGSGALYGVVAVRGAHESVLSNVLPPTEVRIDSQTPVWVPGATTLETRQDGTHILWTPAFALHATIQGYNVYRAILGTDTQPIAIGTVAHSATQVTFTFVDTDDLDDQVAVYFVKPYYGATEGAGSNPVANYPPCDVAVVTLNPASVDAHPECLLP